MGLNGAFLTGDLFNLFVFFEVLLVASFGLLLHGRRGEARLWAGLHYVAINLAASTLFLIAIALLYGLTGTLNLSDLALRVPEIAPGDAPLVRAAALALLVAFSVKAAVFPLHLWLPRAYAAAPPPVAALFALMTKVGVYAIVRVHGLVFGPDAGAAADGLAAWVLGGAVATAAIGALGAFGAQSFARMTAYLTVTSVGTLLIAVGAASNTSLSAGLYYLMHSVLITAALFLLGGAIAVQRGGDGFERAVPVAQPALLGGLFVVGAASVASLPPFSGFAGKLTILQATTTSRPPCHCCGACSWARGCSR
jgi:multicomponent K+:H+ antiporter subunit D